ncbi:hypothetical protein P154DRAFT_425083 [Amniculicola lignicola CBS 123094]|uniref:Rhodopsin domain-containing protein n=1 Tax=Amniculicola lignicola CBS 123094 TaxID=1392246 RepID=A0A6A5WUA7_9PLEO|nr:hypothetical protein P154DRAFT_425083 [Amniculicola lignicola CBS 123094]
MASPSPAGNRVNAVLLSFTALSGSVVFLRLCNRIAFSRNAGFEDACIAFAMACSIGLTITIFEQVRNGLGWHNTGVTPLMFVDFRKAFWASMWIYNLALTFTKVSILVQYHRIFATRHFRIICRSVLGVVAAYGIWTLLGSIFICTPVAFFWDKTIPGGTCLNQALVWYMNAGVNIVTDFTILLLPMPIIRGLNIPKAQRRALMVIFALGGIACIISIVRLRTLVTIANSEDPTYDNLSAATFSAVEVNIGIVCACLPSMRPLFASMLPTYFPNGSRYTIVRTGGNENQFRHLRNLSGSSHTTWTPSLASHSRTGSKVSCCTVESELDNIYKHQSMALSLGYQRDGPVQQVIVDSATRKPTSNAVAPKLPRLPDNMAVIGSVDPTLRRASRHSNCGCRSSRHHPKKKVFQKPLPITPFPVSEPRTK